MSQVSEEYGYRRLPAVINNHPAKSMDKNVIRVGIILCSFRVPAWVRLMVEKITRQEYVALAAVIIPCLKKGSEAPRRKNLLRKGALLEMYGRFDRMIFNKFLLRSDPDALQPFDLREILSDIPVLSVDAAHGKEGLQIIEEDSASIKALELDVLINIDAGNLRGSILHAARCGVWEVFVGEPGKGCNAAPGFFEVTQKHPASVSGVWMQQDDGSGHRILYRSSALTCYYSISRNNNAIFWKSASFIPRLLGILSRTGQYMEGGRSGPEKAVPGVLATAFWILMLWIRTAWKWLHSKFIVQDWEIQLRKEAVLSRSWRGFRRVRSPKKGFWADPFLFPVDGVTYLLMEEYSYTRNRGHIVLASIDGNGNVHSPIPVLKRDYHISYPFVFEWEGSFYMVPETAGNETIELYTCSGDLTQWRFVMNLMENVRAYDTTVYFDGQRWWLLTCMAENRGGGHFDELFLFSADHFKTNKWQAHPCNPIVSDVTHARGAGPLFHMNGKLYRPAQDCSRRYGYNVVLCEIQKFNDEEYVEVPQPFVEGPRSRQIVGVHTLNHTPGLTVIDASQNRWNFRI